MRISEVPPHLVYAAVILLVGLAFAGSQTYFRYQNLLGEKKELQEREDKEIQTRREREAKEADLEACLNFANYIHSYNWAKHCSASKAKADKIDQKFSAAVEAQNREEADRLIDEMERATRDCKLSEPKANRLDRFYSDKKEECFKEYSR